MNRNRARFRRYKLFLVLSVLIMSCPGGDTGTASAQQNERSDCPPIVNLRPWQPNPGLPGGAR